MEITIDRRVHHGALNDALHAYGLALLASKGKLTLVRKCDHPLIWPNEEATAAQRELDGDLPDLMREAGAI